MRAAARIGFSRLLTRYSVATTSLPAADQAVQLTPTDPEAHRARATILSRLRRSMEAEAALEIATKLRSEDDYLWLELGGAREELGDKQGALAAFNEAVRWAPHYAHTHWQRGNLLVRMGRYEEGFADLRQAAVSNRKYLPNLIDLAWGLTGGDAKKTESLLSISNDADRLAFARFLAQKGRGNEVTEQIQLLATPLSDENRAELTRLLSEARSYREAFELWSAGYKLGTIINNGFEEPLLLGGHPLGWIISRPLATAKLAVDVSEKVSGQRSLQISFSGEWSETPFPLSQIIAIEPATHYTLKFFVKTKDLVTGGPPWIALMDATNDQILARSETFPPETNAWQEMSFEFTTPTATEAVVIRLARENCASSPCPIFGVVWLDDFSLQRL
jgi:tetratricopeptide (TPR) repeat protein